MTQRVAFYDTPGAFEDAPGAFEDAPGAFEDAPGVFEDAPGAFEDAPGAFEDAPGAFEHAPCAFEDAPCAFDHAHGAFEDAPGAFEDAPCAFEHAPGAFEHAPCAFEDAPGAFEDAPCAFEDAPCAFEDAPCAFEHAPGAFEDTPGAFEDTPGAFEEETAPRRSPATVIRWLTPVSPAEDQHPLALAREIDEANASLARLHAEHEALRKKLGGEAPPPTTVVRAVDKPGRDGGAYRGADATVALEAALARANAAVANLGIENEMMRSRIDARPSAAAGAWKVLRIVGAVALILLAAYFAVDLLPTKVVSGIGGPLAGIFLALRLMGFKRRSPRK